MKQWPQNLCEPATFDECLDPLIKLVHDWAGEKHPIHEIDTSEMMSLGHYELATCFNVDQALSPEGLKYHKERGRDLFAVVIGIAFQLGIEQGRRMDRQKNEVIARIALRDKDPEWLARAVKRFLGDDE